MLNKAYLILYANIALFLYTLMITTQRLLASPNTFTTVFQNTSRTVTGFINKTLAPVAQWQNIIEILLVFLLILLILRFFNVGLWVLEIAAVLVFLDLGYPYSILTHNITLIIHLEL